MTIEKIDQLLIEWRKKIDVVSQNLIDLYGLPTYQRLSGVAGFPKIQLTGITEAKVTPALTAMNDLFQYFDLLVNTINKATELRKQIPRFLTSEKKLEELEEILTGDSIQLTVVPTPLAQRGLLSAATITNAIAPNKLLTVMIETFEIAKDAVLEVEQAWLVLESSLVEAQTEIISIQKLANLYGINSLNPLSDVNQQITALRIRIDSDPLGVRDNFNQEIKPLIFQTKTQIEQLYKQHIQVKEGLTTANFQLNELIEINQQSQTAFAESQEKVVNHANLKTPLTPREIDALKQWLTRLETKFAEGLLNPVLIGLENLTIKIKEYKILEERVLAANKAPLELRQELRGRLDAIKAKALALGYVEDAVLSELAEKAKQILYTRPTSLEKASELISQYEKRLNNQNLHKNLLS